MVGVPVLVLLGILQAGRSVPAPLSIGGDWTVEFDPAAHCASPPGSILHQAAFNISQSGTEALITLNDGRATTLEATVNGRMLTAGSFTAAIAGTQAERTMDGRGDFAGCAPVAFHAGRQTPKKRGA